MIVEYKHQNINLNNAFTWLLPENSNRIEFYSLGTTPVMKSTYTFLNYDVAHYIDEKINENIKLGTIFLDIDLYIDSNGKLIDV